MNEYINRSDQFRAEQRVAERRLERQIELARQHERHLAKIKRLNEQVSMRLFSTLAGPGFSALKDRNEAEFAAAEHWHKHQVDILTGRVDLYYDY